MIISSRIVKTKEAYQSVLSEYNCEHLSEKVFDEISAIVSDNECYLRTGIQKQTYNTIYQLYSDKLTGKMDSAQTMLFTPDYLAFKLTGVKQNEYTIASTSGLINAKTRNWDWEIIEKLGYKKDIFMPLSNPGTVIGRFTEEIKNAVGFDAYVTIPASHDTASAVIAVPAQNKDFIYISSGTWSLMGVELKDAVYAYMTGPQYETTAEIKMLKTLGADVVGISTVPEMIAASHGGMRGLCISVCTNMASGLSDENPDEDEVVVNAHKAREHFVNLIVNVLKRI